MRPSVAVYGYSYLGYHLLEKLLELDVNVTSVVTHRDPPGENIFFPSVEELAKDGGIPCVIDDEVDLSDVARLPGGAPELAFSFAFRHLLPAPVLEAPKGAFNMHPSPLPLYRGRAPVNWMVLKGEVEGGVTLHRMLERADAGGIVGQRRFPIEPWHAALDVLKNATLHGEKILEEVWDSIESGSPPETAQDLDAGSYFGRRTPEDGRIDWNASARSIADLVRATTRPYPGSFFESPKLGRVMVWWALPLPAASSGAAPGTVLCADDLRGLIVATGDGAISLEVLQLDSGEPQSGAQACESGLFREGDTVT